MVEKFVRALPHGRALPPESWRVRHRVVVALLWVHAVGIAVVASALTGNVVHAVFEAAPVGAAAVIASRTGLRASIRSAVATAGLFTASAIGVHLSGGYIEAHFHFFVMVGVITLYQDWIPFVVALVSTVAHHATVGVIAPESVFNHPAALERPVLWAGIHGAFVLAAASTHLFGWRLSEERFLDGVTHLPNRSLFEVRLDQLLTAQLREGTARAVVLFIDLDDFKSVNDNLGHAAGDELLIAVSARIAAAIRSEDLLARMGGDEFVVLLATTDSTTTPSRVAERIVAALSQPFEIRGTHVVLGSSVGIATFDGSQTAEELLREADTAMYTAKREGKGRHRSFCATMDRTANNRIAMRSELETALRDEQLTVHYQPVLATTTGAVVAVEALVRWQHAIRGLVLPDQFVPHAESSAMIATIDRSVLTQACSQVRRWNADRVDLPGLDLSVNVSAHHLLMDDFYEELDAILSSTRLDPNRLIVEITETALVTNLDTAKTVLSRVRDLGVRVAIDDFGMGQSSLRYLRTLPVDVLKIDRSFIQPLGSDVEDEAIARAITKLGHDLGLQVIAEGIETPAQLARVSEMGCDLMQGYLFSAPLDAVTTELYIDEHGISATRQSETGDLLTWTNTSV